MVLEFIIQHNLLNNCQLLKIKKAVKDVPHRFVGLIPFSREITSDTPLEGDQFIPYGSTSFVETAYERKWKGLCFNIEEFTISSAKAYKETMMLNGGFILSAMEFDAAMDGLDRRIIFFFVQIRT